MGMGMGMGMGTGMGIGHARVHDVHMHSHVHVQTCTWEPCPHSSSLPPTAYVTLPVRTCAVLLLTLLPPIGLTLPLSWWLACPLHTGGADVSMLHNVFKGEGAAADGARHAVRTPGRRSTPALVRRGRRRHRVRRAVLAPS
jgi:hypothetical protein